jgi:hypothetical protein
LRNLLKDNQGRYVPGALFDWELTDELANPKTDAERRDALAAELGTRRFHEARLKGLADGHDAAIHHHATHP